MEHSGKIRKITLSYYDSVIALALLYILSKTELFTSNAALATIVDILQWPFLIFISSTLIEFKIKKKAIKYGFIATIIVVLFFISYRNSGLANLFKFTIIILAAKRLNNYRIFRSLRNVYLFIILLVVSLGAMRVIPSNVVRRGYFTYGFIHSNVLAMFVFSTVCCDLIATRKKVSYTKCILYVIVLAVTIVLTDCRSVAIGFCVIFMMLMVFAVANKAFRKKTVLHWILCSFPILFTIISLYIAYNFSYTNPVMNKINDLASNRVYMAHRLTEAYSLTLLGQDCGTLLMENAYITVFFAWGIIPGTITVLYYCFSIHKSLIRRHYNITACLIGFAVQGIFEGSSLELFLNFALITTFIRISTHDRDALLSLFESK